MCDLFVVLSAGKTELSRIPKGPQEFQQNKHCLWFQVLKWVWNDATAVKEAHVCGAFHFESVIISQLFLFDCPDKPGMYIKTYKA